MKHEWQHFLSIGVPGVIGAACSCGLISLLRDDPANPPQVPRCPNDRDELPGPGDGETAAVTMSERPAGTVLHIAMPPAERNDAAARAGDYEPPAPHLTAVRPVADGKTGKTLQYGIAKERPAPDPAMHRQISPEQLAARGLASVNHIAR